MSGQSSRDLDLAQETQNSCVRCNALLFVARRFFVFGQLVVPLVVGKAKFRRGRFGFANADFTALIQKFLNECIIGSFFGDMFHETNCSPGSDLGQRPLCGTKRASEVLVYPKTDLFELESPFTDLGGKNLLEVLETLMAPDINTARKLAQDHCAAWTDKSPERVANRYAEKTSMVMNGGEPMTSRAQISDMAQGFMADFPDLVLSLDTVLVADHHMVYAWTFEGIHEDTGNHVRFSGWEEWDLDENLNVSKSLGWYDSVDYDRQVAGA